MATMTGITRIAVAISPPNRPPSDCMAKPSACRGSGLPARRSIGYGSALEKRSAIPSPAPVAARPRAIASSPLTGCLLMIARTSGTTRISGTAMTATAAFWPANQERSARRPDSASASR